MQGHYQQATQLLQALQAGNYRWRFEASFAYERDALGRLTRQTQDSPTGQSQHRYSYDDAGRLLSHSRDGQTIRWGYDANGNRTHENGQPIARYDSQDRLLEWKDKRYTYNPAGDLLEKATPQGSTRYHYDSLGNLRQVNLPGGEQIDYLIDPLGRRIGKRKNGQTQYGLIYQDSLRPVADSDETGRLRSVYLYADKRHVPSGLLRNGKSYLIISDHLGSVRLVVDTQSGRIEQSLDYDAWGQVIHDSQPGFQPFGYAGGLYDPDTGLTRFGARDYDAETGRWTAKDPILFDGGDTNLYGYVLQDPVNLMDPRGLAAPAIALGIRIAGGAAAGNGIRGAATRLLGRGAGRVVACVLAGSCTFNENSNESSENESSPDIPDPNGVVPGGPWESNPDNRAGNFLGPKNPSGGGRSQCQWVPRDGEGGPAGSEGYWKVNEHGKRGWNRFNRLGQPITPAQAHPGNLLKP